jgi:5-methylcytosine-specific restriction endonuclease McrA
LTLPILRGTRSNLQVHHIIYRSHGGPDAEDNLITLLPPVVKPSTNEGRNISTGDWFYI